MFAKSCPYGTKPLQGGAPEVLNYMSALSRAVAQAGQTVEAHLQQGEGHLVDSIVETTPHYLGELTGQDPGKEPTHPSTPELPTTHPPTDCSGFTEKPAGPKKP